MKSRHFATIALGLVVSALATLFVYAVHDLEYFPDHQDEVHYYLGARSFHETSSVRAPEMNDEAVAPLLEANWYGVFYALFYGAMMNIGGVNAANFVLTNAVLLMTALLLLARSDLTADDKRLTSLLFLSLGPVSIYSFTLFPEVLHLVFAVVLSLLLCRMDRNNEGEISSRDLWLYMACVVVFTLFRVTTVLWLAALIAYARTWGQVRRYVVLLAAGVFLTFLYTRCCTAPMFFPGGRLIEDATRGDVRTIVRALALLRSNAAGAFRAIDFQAFVTVAAMVLVGVCAAATRKRILVAATLVAFSYLAVLLTFYVPPMFYMNKQTACLMPLFVIATAGSGVRPMRLALAVLILGSAPMGLLKGLEVIKWHRWSYRQYVLHADQAAAFRLVSSLVDPDRGSIVLWAYREHDYPGQCSAMLLPLRNVNGWPIRYTTNMVRTSASPAVKFRTHGKLNVRYVLSRNPLSLPRLRLLYGGRYFFFYRLEN